MIIAKALKAGAQKLKSLSEPHFEAELILALTLKTSREKIILYPNKKLSAQQVSKYESFIKQRRHGIPLAYLSGIKHFYSTNFKVNRRVLVPRPETELIVELSIDIIKHQPITQIIDIGTGSGCLAISLAKLFPNKKILASDISDQALKLAKMNAKFNKVKTIKFIKGDNFKPFVKNKLLSQTLIISNPPYLLTKEIKQDLKFEPRLALDGGTDGLTWYKNFIKYLIKLDFTKLPPYILLEIHSRLCKKTEQLFTTALPSYQTKIINDLSKRPRLLLLNKKL